jgi:hypothetical protein
MVKLLSFERRGVLSMFQAKAMENGVKSARIMVVVNDPMQHE